MVRVRFAPSPTVMPAHNFSVVIDDSLMEVFG